YLWVKGRRVSPSPKKHTQIGSSNCHNLHELSKNVYCCCFCSTHSPHSPRMTVTNEGSHFRDPSRLCRLPVSHQPMASVNVMSSWARTRQLDRRHTHMCQQSTGCSPTVSETFQDKRLSTSVVPQISSKSRGFQWRVFQCLGRILMNLKQTSSHLTCKKMEQNR
uniref:Uncharacterized protein n=1 Tax=Anopheles arabiensis TaxID=7173 RepID=A0A182IGU8_ANOAR